MLSRSQQLLLGLSLCLSVARADVSCSAMPKVTNPLDCCPLPELATAEMQEKCRPNPHAMSPCFFKCIFEHSGISYNGKEVEQDAVKAYLLSVLKDNAELQSVADAALTACIQEEYEDISPILAAQFECTQFPEMLMSCTYSKMMNNCPTSFWKDSQECNERREFFKSCDISALIPQNSKAENP